MSTMLTAAGLVLCAISILLQIAFGADYPTVPPGAIITGAAGLLVAFVPWRYIPLPGLVVAAFILLGAIVTPNTGDHLGAGDVGLFLSTVLQLVGLVVAVVFGLLATVRPFRRTPTDSTR